MNTNTLNVTGQQSFTQTEKSAQQDVGSSTTQKIAFVLVWAAVSVPLIWGVMKAWEEVQGMF
jgi:hypothetical protein